MTQTIRDMNYDTQLLARRLAKMEPGNTITYKEMSTVIGKDILEHRHVLSAARRIVLRENRIVFETVRNVGVTRLSDGEIVNSAVPMFRKKVRSVARRVKKEIGAVDHEKLTHEERVQRDMGLIMVGFTDTITSTQNTARLETRIKFASELPSLGDAFAVLSNSKQEGFPEAVTLPGLKK